MSIRLFRRPAALICSLALLPALSPAALAAGAPAVSDKKSALIRHSANFQTRPKLRENCERVVKNKSSYILVCARLCHVTGAQWGNQKHINIKYSGAALKDNSVIGCHQFGTACILFCSELLTIIFLVLRYSDRGSRAGVCSTEKALCRKGTRLFAVCFQTRPGPDKLQCLFGETAIAVSGLRCVCRDLIYSQRS